MTVALTIFQSAWEELVSMFEETRLETVAVALAGRANSRARNGLIIGSFESVPAEGYLVRTAGNFQLAPAYVAGLALRAQASNRALVIAHSHPGSDYPAAFSPTDDRMNAALSRSLLAQIRGPFAALVRSPGGVSSTIWRTPGEGERVELIRIVGRGVMLLRRDEQPDEDFEPWERQIRAFGRGTQKLLRQVRLGVVGAGGTGSIAAISAAHLGVSNFVLVDPDSLERSNLSRVLGSRASDLDGGAAPTKVSILARAIREIRPEAQVETWTADVVEVRTLRALADCDVILSCTDTHASRAALEQLPYHYGVPVLDVGTLIRNAAGKTEAFADLRLATIGGACLSCQGVVDPARVLEERLPPAQRALFAERGYIAGAVALEPSVLPVNELAVSLAMNRLLDLLATWLDWLPRVTINIRTLEILQRVAHSLPNCPTCGSVAIMAGGDDEPLIGVGATLSVHTAGSMSSAPSITKH
ncbi:MAG: ThiF family adenylyltransferase [Chloroflexota bacterium]|nr:ThiF family adenylyltransferase [Chloroflexota bacterium]